MKTKLLYLVAIFLIAGLSNNLMAQNTATAADVPATATIVAPIAISLANTGLQFGTIVKGSGDVTVAATSTSARTAENGVTYLIAAGTGNGTAVSSAQFTVTGEGAYTFDLDLPENGDITLDEDGAGTGTMVVKDFTSNGDDGTGDTASTLSSGTKTIYVGATLVVGATQTSGTYSSTFDVTVAYN